MTAMEWGAKPLPEQERYAVLVREITSQVLSLERSTPVLTDLLATLEKARTELAGLMPPGPHPRVGPHLDGDGRVFIDHCRNIGSFNPVFPVYEITVEGPERAFGTVTFPVAYEGPAGCVNGGFLAVFFDEVVQHHNCELGLSGATRDFDIRYRRPTPLGIDLTFDVRREVSERAVFSDVRLFRNGDLVCSATTNAAIYTGAQSPAVADRKGS